MYFPEPHKLLKHYCDWSQAQLLASCGLCLDLASNNFTKQLRIPSVLCPLLVQSKSQSLEPRKQAQGVWHKL